MSEPCLPAKLPCLSVQSLGWGRGQAAPACRLHLPADRTPACLAYLAAHCRCLRIGSFLFWCTQPASQSTNCSPAPHHQHPAVAEAVLTYGGGCVRATFTFDRFGRVARMRSSDFLRRLPSGAFEAGEWQIGYSGHMLFG